MGMNEKVVTFRSFLCVCVEKRSFLPGATTSTVKIQVSSAHKSPDSDCELKEFA